MPELTPEDIANGWDEESLDMYQAERDRVTYEKIYFPKKTRPKFANSQYRPLRWR